MFIVGIAFWGLSATEGFKECANQYKNKYTSNQLEKQNSGASAVRPGWSEINLTCIGESIYTYRDTINAVSTLSVAVFTFSLWISTHLMWRVATRQADIAERAITDIERPYVLVRGTWVEKKRNFDDQTLIAFRFTLHNYGKHLGEFACARPWVIGRISYRSVFRRRHTTNFCFRGGHGGSSMEMYGPPYNERT